MEPRLHLKPGAERYRGITEKSKALLFLLREAPYITLADAKRFFYPAHKTISYAREMIRVLVKNELVGKYRMGDGLFIYYLTDSGRRITEFFTEDRPKFDPETKSLYYSQKPTKPSEVAALFIFSARDLEFHAFAPHFLSSHPLLHTRALMELSVRLRLSFRFVYVLWLDAVKHKQTALHISCHPDLLLTNDLRSERRRIYVELENSPIKAQALANKLDRLCSVPADWVVFLCTSDLVFHNLGRLIRKILSGLVKISKHQTLFLSPRVHAALFKNILIGQWIPSWKNEGKYQSLKSTMLYRYDAPIFDSHMWVRQATPEGILATDPQSGHPLHVLMPVTYAARKPGEKEITLGTIMDRYREDFKAELGRLTSGPNASLSEKVS